MKKVTLKFDIIQVDSIAPFYWNELPYLHFHYFLLNPESGQFTWLWVEEKTDFEWLQQKINEGLIFINE